MAKIDHTHTYKRVKYGKSFVFRCMKEGCSHFIHPQFIEGRKCECPYCHTEFTIGAREKRMKYPHCNACRERMRMKYQGNKEEREVIAVRSADDIAELFKSKFGE